MKLIKILSVLLSLLLTVSFFAGCNKDDSFPTTVGGAEITAAPQKVVAFSEQAASAIFALGYDSYLIGAPEEFLPEPVDGITNIGYTRYIDFDTVYELDPDVVIAPAELESSYLESMKLRDITVVTLATPTKYSEIAPYYEAISKLFLGKNNYTEAYDACVGEMQRVVKELKATNSAINKKIAVFVEPDFPVTGDTLAGQTLTEAGFNNIANDATDYMMSADEIVKANPDVIFCAVGSSETIMEKESYKNITAIKNAAVYEIDISALIYAGEGYTAVLQDMSTYLSKLK